MRFLAWFGGIVVTLLVAVYVVAFTPFGNSMLAPMIESEIAKKTNLDSRLSKFTLNMSEIEILLELDSYNTISLKGNYSIASKSFDISYVVNLNNLSTLKPLTLTDLQGSLYTDGKIAGDISYLEVDGRSDIGESDTVYHIEFTKMSPTSIIAKIKDAKLSSLLYMVAQSQYASADVDLDINFKNITPGKLDGDISLKTNSGKIDSALMKKDFNVTVPNTSFAINMDAVLKGDNIDYKCDLNSNLFKILSSGLVVPEPFKTDIKYSLNIKELALLKPVTKAELRGALRLDGTLKGSKENLLLKAKSDIAGSDTTIEATLKDFAPSAVLASVKNLRVEKLLYMMNQPHYSDGLLSIDADIKDARAGNLKGKIETKLERGLLDSAFLTEHYKFKSMMPRTGFDLLAVSDLNANTVKTKVDFNSNIAKIDINSAVFDMKSAHLKSDYKAAVQNLDKLFFVTDKHMRGAVVVTGELSKTDDLDINAHTKIAEGAVDATVHNDDVSAKIKSVKTKGLLYMLMYPDIFQADLNADVKYDLAKSIGSLNGHVVDGNFVRNNAFDLIKQYTKFDMYRESFNGDVSAKINKENVLSSLELRSSQASITTKDTKLNTKTNIIDSDITVKAKKNVIPINLNGDINSPRVNVDLKRLMESETGKAIEKGINKLLNKFFQ